MRYSLDDALPCNASNVLAVFSFLSVIQPVSLPQRKNKTNWNKGSTFKIAANP